MRGIPFFKGLGLFEIAPGERGWLTAVEGRRSLVPRTLPSFRPARCRYYSFRRPRTMPAEVASRFISFVPSGPLGAFETLPPMFFTSAGRIW